MVKREAVVLQQRAAALLRVQAREEPSMRLWSPTTLFGLLALGRAENGSVGMPNISESCVSWSRASGSESWVAMTHAASARSCIARSATPLTGNLLRCR